jgi:Mg-chelatase subunit ChlD
VNNFSVQFTNPWFLFLLIPAFLLTLIPFFRIKKRYRYTRNRVASLIIRAVTLTLAVFLIAGLSFRADETHRKDNVMVVVDVSATSSLSLQKREEALEGIIRESNGDYNVGIIVFGAEAEVAVGLTRNTANMFDRYKRADRPDGSASNVEAALALAYRELADVKDNARVILLTDAAETDGSARAAVSRLAGEGIRVDTMLFSPEASAFDEDAFITQIKFAGDNAATVGTGRQETVTGLSADDVLTVEVYFQSQGPERPAVLRLYNDTTLIGERSIRLNQNGQFARSERFEYTLPLPGLYKFRAELATAADSVPANNEYWAFVNIAGGGKILLLEGSASEGTAGALHETLLRGYEEENIQVERVAGAVDLSLSFIQGFDEVILVGVSNEDLASRNGLVETLDTYVNTLGGGLLTVGGGGEDSGAYRAEDMRPDGQSTAFEKMLPVESRPSARPLSLLIMIDASSSMNNGGASGEGVPPDAPGGEPGSRLQIAKQAAKDGVRLLENADSVAVIYFSSPGHTKIALEWTSVVDKGTIDAAIDGITMQQGTTYNLATQEALALMNRTDSTNRRHIIFLTDGKPTDGNDGGAITYPDTIKTLVSLGVTFSTIGIEIGADEADVLSQLADLGGGQYSNPAASGLNDVMQEEVAKNVPVRYNSVPDQAIQPAWGTNADFSLTAGVGIPPLLYGYYAVSTKEAEGARAVLNTPAGNPIYAEWRYGAGRVGSFMSTLDGDWGVNYVNSGGDEMTGGERFILNVVQNLRAPKSPTLGNVAVRFNADTGTDVYRNYSTLGSLSGTEQTPLFADGDTLTATVITPSGAEKSIDMRRMANAADGIFETREAGIYTVRVVRKDRNGTVLFETEDYFACPYSYEYDSSIWTEENRKEYLTKMESLAVLGGGRLWFSEAQMFDMSTQTVTKTTDPRLGFLIAVVALFLLDIAARKFKFKWPHELVREAKARKAEKAARNQPPLV